jgi:hypothetical protein
MALSKLRSLDGSTGITVQVSNVSHVKLLPAAEPLDPAEMTTEQKARAIIDAGRRRRGELNDDPAPELSETAKAILAAGRKRRNEED